MSSLIVAVLIIAQLSTQNSKTAPVDPLTTAKAAAERGVLPEAEAEARQYLALHQNSASGHFLLGYILFRETKARESLAEYTEGAKYERPSAADLRVVGADYVLLSDYGDADKWFTKSTEWAPGNVLGWYYLARTKYNENRFEEAVAAFKECLKLDPKHVRAEDNLGLTLQALGRTDEAQQAFENAIQWQASAPVKSPWPYIDFGSFLLENNQPEKAVPCLQRALEIAPDSAKAHQLAGKAYLSLGQLSRAQAELEWSVKLEPDNARAHYVLGQLYQKEGESEKARQEFAQYSRLNARHPGEDNREFRSVAPN